MHVKTTNDKRWQIWYRLRPLLLCYGKVGKGIMYRGSVRFIFHLSTRHKSKCINTMYGSADFGAPKGF